MKSRKLFSDKGYPKKQVVIYYNDDGDEILTHYGTPIAGVVNGIFVKSDRYYSQTSSRNINLYFQGSDAVEVDESYLRGKLRDI